MARPIRRRTAAGEANLAVRVKQEREKRGLSYAALAAAMTDAGCKMHPSSLNRIENGDPPRTIGVDELLAFSKVFNVPVDDLLTPIALVHQERARDAVEAFQDAGQRLVDATKDLLPAYVQTLAYQASDPELAEYMSHQLGTLAGAEGFAGQAAAFTVSLKPSGQQIEVDAPLLEDAFESFFFALVDVAERAVVDVVAAELAATDASPEDVAAVASRVSGRTVKPASRKGV